MAAKTVSYGDNIIQLSFGSSTTPFHWNDTGSHSTSGTGQVPKEWVSMDGWPVRAIHFIPSTGGDYVVIRQGGDASDTSLAQPILRKMGPNVVYEGIWDTNTISDTGPSEKPHTEHMYGFSCKPHINFAECSLADADGNAFLIFELA